MPSSVVRSMSYNPSLQRLRIVYVSGMVYDYLQVPPNEYEAMKSAFSKGTYLNQHIKGHYRFRKID
ncbi:MAG: KTSC domain-containing protein [Sediminibacterium sp.]